MKKFVSLLCAALISSCASVQMIPVNTVVAADSSAIIEEQLDMPIISIDTLGNSVSSKESYTTATVTIWNENGDIDTAETEVQIRLRGNITLNSPKRAISSSLTKSRILCHWGTAQARAGTLSQTILMLHFSET